MTDSSAIALPLGMAFGALVRSCGVYSPQIIRAQMVFHHQIMLKMFMGGLLGSSLSLSLLAWADADKLDKVRSSKGFGDKGAVGAIVGGMIQGAGMTLSGACPGMIYAQIGAGSETAPLVLIGGLCGAGAYALLHPYLGPLLERDFASTLQHRFESMHLERVLFGAEGGSGFIKGALGLGAVALAVAVALETAVPSPEVFGYDFNPVLAGALVGGLQVPLFLGVGALLGMSSGYSVLSSQVLSACCPASADLAYMRSFADKQCRSWWQVVFGGGVVLGAYLVPNTPRPAEVEAVQAFVGGALLVFGARVVGGCASGHGLTGLPSLHVVSWLAVPAIFAGAILTGNLLSWLWGKPSYLLMGF